MWIFTKEGFFSVTELPQSRDVVLIRARTREDLEALIGGMYNEACWHRFPILETPTSDYRWRAVLNRDEVADHVSGLVRTIDYDNVKDSIDKGDQRRHTAMVRVWAAMLTLQDGEEYTWPDEMIG
jgi:hypothetical protein